MIEFFDYNEMVPDKEKEEITTKETSPIEIVATGKWVWFEEKYGNPSDGYDYDWGWRCSNCMTILPDDFDDPENYPKINYCYNCGSHNYRQN